MVNKADQERIKALLSEAVTVLCKNSLGYHSEFSVEGLLGITVDKQDIFLINIKENVYRGAGGDSPARNGNARDLAAAGAPYNSDDDEAFNSTLHGVTGEFVEVAGARRLVQQSLIHSQQAGGGRGGRGGSKEEGSTVKSEQGGGKSGKGGGAQEGGGGAGGQPGLLAGDLVLGGGPWADHQGLAGTSLSVSQAVAVSAPLVAASMGQMPGIAQQTQEWFMREGMRLSTQLDGRRRKSRDHMRRYRQQLRTSNYSEYEDRKRRQREGMRRYRERLRVENPEKYAEMNRKHAEQERRRRLRVRSMSGSMSSTSGTPTTVTSSALQAGDGSKVVTTDFLHMAMENSQLLPVRDVHQLLPSGFPLPAGIAGGAVGGAGGPGGAGGGLSLGLTAGAVSLGPGTGLGVGLGQVTAEEVSSHQHPSDGAPSSSHSALSGAGPVGGQGGSRSLQPGGSSSGLPSHTLTVQQQQQQQQQQQSAQQHLLPSTSSTSSPGHPSTLSSAQVAASSASSPPPEMPHRSLGGGSGSGGLHHSSHHHHHVPPPPQVSASHGAGGGGGGGGSLAASVLESSQAGVAH